MALPNFSVYSNGAITLNCRSGNRAGCVRNEHGNLLTAGWHHRAGDDDFEDAEAIVYSPTGDTSERTE